MSGVDVTDSMLGILPPVIAAGAVMGIMNQTGLTGNKGGGGMFGQSPAPAAPANNGAKKISQRSAIKLFGMKKAMLAKGGTEVSNEDGEILFYDNGFYLA